MPCTDASDEQMRDYYADGLQDKVDELTRLLCMACSQLVDEHVSLSPEIRAWSNAHDEADRKRIEHEKGEAGRQRAARISHMNREVELMESRILADKAKAAAYRAELEKLEEKA